MREIRQIGRGYIVVPAASIRKQKFRSLDDAKEYAKSLTKETGNSYFVMRPRWQFKNEGGEE